jgi:hypothetical protein
MEGIYADDLLVYERDPLDIVGSGFPTLSAIDITQSITDSSYIQTDTDSNYLQPDPSDLNNSFLDPEPSDLNTSVLEPDACDLDNNFLEPDTDGGNPPHTYALFAAQSGSKKARVDTSTVPNQAFVETPATAQSGSKKARVDTSTVPNQAFVETPATAQSGSKKARVDTSTVPNQAFVETPAAPEPQQAPVQTQRLTRRGLPMRGSAMLVAARVASIVSWENATEESSLVRNVANIIDTEISREVSRKRGRPQAPQSSKETESNPITFDDSECDDGADGDSEMEQCSEPDEDDLDTDFVAQEDVEEICSSSDEEEEEEEDDGEDEDKDNDEYKEEDEDELCEEDDEDEEEDIIASETEDDVAESESVVESKPNTSDVICME